MFFTLKFVKGYSSVLYIFKQLIFDFALIK